MWIGQPHIFERGGEYFRSRNCLSHLVGTTKTGQFYGVFSVGCAEKHFENAVEWLDLFE